MTKKEKVLNILNNHLEYDDFESYMFYVKSIIENNEPFGVEVPKQVENFALNLLKVSEFLKDFNENKIKIYTIDSENKWKQKRTISKNDYELVDCNSSCGMKIKHKKTKKELFLCTLEFYEYFIEEANKLSLDVGKTYSYAMDENGNKLRDKKGKLIKKYTSYEDVEKYRDIALKGLYITNEDFIELFNHFREDK